MPRPTIQMDGASPFTFGSATASQVKTHLIGKLSQSETAPYRRAEALVQLDYLFNGFSMSASDSLAQLQKVEHRRDDGLAGRQEPASPLNREDSEPVCGRQQNQELDLDPWCRAAFLEQK